MATKTTENQSGISPPQQFTVQEGSFVGPDMANAVSAALSNYQSTYPTDTVPAALSGLSPSRSLNTNNSVFKQSSEQLKALTGAAGKPQGAMRQNQSSIPGVMKVVRAPVSSKKKTSTVVVEGNTTESALTKGTPLVSNYTDYSRMPKARLDTDISSNEYPSLKEPSFPVKLHQIISAQDHEEFITWLPHGRSWRVLKPRAFETKVIPLYFRHAKYASFMRQVNGWGFKRITKGPDQNSYYHELFLRGLPHLCPVIERPPEQTRQASSSYNPAQHIGISANANKAPPDFYHLSSVAPVPPSTPAPLAVAAHDYQPMTNARHQHPAAYENQISSSGAEGSGESTPYQMHCYGGGSSVEGGKATMFEVGPGDSNGSDNDRLSDGATAKQFSSTSSDYAGGSEGGGDSSSDSDPSPDDKGSAGGNGQNTLSIPAENNEYRQKDWSSRGQQRARAGFKKRSSDSVTDASKKPSDRRSQPMRGGIEGFAYPTMGNGSIQMARFPGAPNVPCIVPQQGAGSQAQSQQMMYQQQQPQMVRVVNQNGGEIGYIQLPNQGLQGHQNLPFVQQAQLMTGQSPQFSQQVQMLQGVPTFVSQQGQMMQAATMQSQQVQQQPVLQQQMFHPQMMLQPQAQGRPQFRGMPSMTLPFQITSGITQQQAGRQQGTPQQAFNNNNLPK